MVYGLVSQYWGPFPEDHPPQCLGSCPKANFVIKDYIIDVNSANSTGLYALMKRVLPFNSQDTLKCEINVRGHVRCFNQI